MAENLLSPDALESAINDLSRREIGQTDIGAQAILTAARFALGSMRAEDIKPVTPARFAQIVSSEGTKSLNVRYGLLDLAQQAYGPAFHDDVKHLMPEAQNSDIGRTEAAN